MLKCNYCDAHTQFCDVWRTKLICNFIQDASMKIFSRAMDYLSLPTHIITIFVSNIWIWTLGVGFIYPNLCRLIFIFNSSFVNQIIIRIILAINTTILLLPPKRWTHSLSPLVATLYLSKIILESLASLLVPDKKLVEGACLFVIWSWSPPLM